MACLYAHAILSANSHSFTCAHSRRPDCVSDDVAISRARHVDWEHDKHALLVFNLFQSLLLFATATKISGERTRKPTNQPHTRKTITNNVNKIGTYARSEPPMRLNDANKSMCSRAVCGPHSLRFLRGFASVQATRNDTTTNATRQGRDRRTSWSHSTSCCGATPIFRRIESICRQFKS